MISVETPECDTHDKLDNLQASFATGKLKDIKYRRHEISKLYRRLREDAESVCNAMASDGFCSATAAEEEFRLTMDGMRKFHSGLKILYTRRKSTRPHQDDFGRRSALGLVAIRPTAHSRLYSTLIPLTGAIAAGNCVFLELAEEQCSVNELLAEILESTLDPGTAQISNERIKDGDLSQVSRLVDQTDGRKTKAVPLLTGLRKQRAVAVVHPSSKLVEASQLITASRLSPHNASPYSPSLIHVHHAALLEFREACMACSEDFPSPYANKSACTVAGNKLDTLLKEAEAQGVVKTYHNTTSGLSLVEAQPRLHRSSPIISSQIKGPYIIVLPFTHAMDFTCSMSKSDPLLAVYIFGEVVTCKSLAEDIPASVTYCNQIPLSLLYGPASPASHLHRLHPRYTTDMFSTPSPIIVSLAPGIPKEMAELVKRSRSGSRSGDGGAEQVKKTFLQRVSAFIVIPAAISVIWGFWSLKRSGGRGSVYTTASLVRDMREFGG